MTWAGGVAAQATLPAVKFVTGPLVSPTNAETFYGSATTHTNSLAGISGFGATAPEIVETARALKNNPDLIFEFVHNQIEPEFAFGERKGAVGTLIDKSGTPFDQNVLFVNLVRQAGFTTQYQIGTVTLTSAAFTAWTGVSDLGAACQMLASGGIPATFTPAAPANCQTSGAFTNVTFLHAWSKVQISGVWYYYDPSIKTLAGPAPLNLTTGSGYVSGQASTSAATGMDSGTTSGAPYIHNASEPTLNTYLAARGSQLLGWLKTNAPALDTDTVVGITKIQPVYAPVGGWRNTTAPGTAYLTVPSTTDMPDQFRTQFQVQLASYLSGPLAPLLPAAGPQVFFVDDIDGRRIGIDTNFDNLQSPPINPQNYSTQTERLVVDDVVVATTSCTVNTTTCKIGLPGQLTLTAIHPYAASATQHATFADETVVKALTTITVPVAIISGWGAVSPARLAKWSDEVAEDKTLPAQGSVPFSCLGGQEWCVDTDPTSAGDLTRQKLAASWLAQMTRMVALQAAIGNATVLHQHSLGVVDWRATLQGNEFPPTGGPNYYGVKDEFTDLNIDTVLSVTSKSDSASSVAALSRSMAVASATLEGSVLEQMEDLPDTASTASRFAWGNQPDNEDPCFTTNTPRPFYDFTGTTETTRGTLYLYEDVNYPPPPPAQPACSATPSITPSTSYTQFISQTDGAVTAYLAAGFHVTASAETFLGPGARFGPAEPSTTIDYNDPSQQRGGALVATLWTSGSGSTVLQVAHTLTSLSGISKGGGGKEPISFTEYDPAKAADVLKDRFVDRSVVLGVDLKTGSAGWSTPSLLSIGAGGTPYKLDYGLTFKAAPSGCSDFGPCTGPVQGGWNQSWDVRFSNSGSGAEAMGATTPFAAADSLVAFLALQDIYQQSGLADLNKDVFAALTADWWRQQMIANVATINRGFSGAQYLRQADGTWAPPIGSPGTLTQTGVRVKARDQCPSQGSKSDASSTARRWEQSGVTFSLKNAAGDVLSISPWKWNYEPEISCKITYGYKPTSWTWPQGPSLTFGYDYQQGVTSIATSLGRSMTFTAPVEGLGGLTATTGVSPNARTGGQQTNAGGFVTGIADSANDAWTFVYTPLLARSATQRPVPYPELSQVFEPVSSNFPALQYSYDTRGMVETASDATALQWGTRGPYAWYLATGGRGERDDPDGGAYTVYYDTDGDAVRNIDELGREVDSAWDGRHRVSSRTYPETDQDQFAYNLNDNVTSLTKVAKTGSGLSNIVIQASYDPTWDKLASITDPMGNVTNFTYFASGNGASLMQTAQRPAIGSTRPTFSYQYNSIGLPTSSIDPTGVATTHVYDSYGNLTSTTEGARNGSDLAWNAFSWGSATFSSTPLNLTTTFTPDAWGNVTAVVDPRGNAALTQYDAMRRKTQEQNNNGGVSALPLMEKTFVYDGDGRLTTENRATGFNSSGVPTGWQTWLTAYTPTGKTAVATDPLGNATTTVYDDLDRPAQVIDASGRVTAKTYDIAGQELTEVRGYGSPSPVTYATYSWWPDGEKQSVKDAKNNTINLAYDGFNRLSKITLPDSSTEQSAYDTDGDLTIWTNRGGYSIVRCYDVLNRKVSEAGITGATNGGACPTGGTRNIAARSWDLEPATFGYDLAGRMLSATSPRIALIWEYDAAGRPVGRWGNWTTRYAWDGAGNMTSVTYPDGSVFTYQYDALNRTSAALQGSTTLASLTYDPLGRRNVLTFNDASSQTWGYDNADRVTSLVHAFPTTTDNVTLTYGYDAAGRELSRTTSNSAYRWSPAVATTTYATANSLNQYPSVNAFSYSYWPEGPVEQTEAYKAYYDEEGKLATAYVTPTPGTIDPNNWEENTFDPLGHLMFHERHPATAQPCPYWYHSTDGLRPETVLDSQYGETGACGGSTFQGYRRFVLGPDPDERWAFLDMDGATYFPHTDREGTTIALSTGGAAVQKYQYGAYGESTDAFTEVGPGSTSYAFRYTGQRLDGGTGLYDYKARFYSTGLGRFLQPDPAGLDQGPNLYEYVANDPLAANDPTGNCPPAICKSGDFGSSYGGISATDVTLGGGSTGSLIPSGAVSFAGAVNSTNAGGEQLAANGPAPGSKPNLKGVIPSPRAGTSTLTPAERAQLDPRQLNEKPENQPSAMDEEALAGTVETTIKEGIIGAHPYQNFPDKETGARMPVAVGRTYQSIPIPGGRNNRRLLVSSDNLYFYTTTHYKSFIELNIGPLGGQ